MLKNGKIYLAQGESPLYLLPEMANRHGLIAGATGTGKTITLKVLAEAFSELGVPVFLADIKGDLAGMCRPGVESEALRRRIDRLGLRDFAYQSYPTRFWDIFGEEGHAMRTTVSEMGPLLFSRLLDLNDTQTGVLTIVFRIADDNDMLLLDLKDLRVMLQYVGEHGKEFATQYGNVTRQSVGAIQRALLTLEDQGGDFFFGEPALDIDDWLRRDGDGRGYINILHCTRLFTTPALYATFLLWMLGELFEHLPEVGDTEKPRLVFFFDEAHLLFDDVPKVLLQKIEQVVRLIRSKGVGVYFVTQNPCDIPGGVLSQLGNRIQHALRAYTPAELRTVRAAAAAFRPNPAFSTEEAITQLGTGEALVSCLDEEGRPSVVERAIILPPQSQMGAIERGERDRVITESEFDEKYARPIDRWSAFEQMQEQTERDTRQRAYEAEQNAYEAEQKAYAAERARQQRAWEKEQARLEKERAKAMRAYSAPAPRRTTRAKKSAFEKFADQTINTMGREVGKSLVRGLLGSFGKR